MQELAGGTLKPAVAVMRSGDALKFFFRLPYKRRCGQQPGPALLARNRPARLACYRKPELPAFHRTGSTRTTCKPKRQITANINRAQRASLKQSHAYRNSHLENFFQQR